MSRLLTVMCLACGWWLSAVDNAMSAPPTLTHLSPAGGQRGTKVVVTCAGTFTWPPKVWSPGIEATPTADSGKLEVSIPADLAADRVWIRLYNAEGTSALQPFLIGSLAEAPEVEPNDRPRQAQAVPDPHITINGALKDKDVDCFVVQLQAGQTLVAALDANTRLGSPMDAILQIVTQEGIVLAENHDDLKLDPRLAFTAPTADSYIVRLVAFPAAPDSSIRFAGGASYIYRLTLTTGPCVTHAIPLSVPLADPGTVAAAGWNIPNDTKMNVVPLGGGKLVEHQEYEILDDLRRSPDARLGFAFAADFATSTRVRLTPYAAILRPAQPDEKAPVVIPVSSSVTGCLKNPREAHVYHIALTKGQQIVIAVEARSLDLPLDPVLKLTTAKGAVIADVDDTGATRDSVISHTAKEDGDVVLTVSDRYRQGGSRCWYLLTVRPEQADFDLTLAAEAVTITTDKPGEVVVKVKRHATATEGVGPITIQVTGLPEGVTSPEVLSEIKGATAAEVKVVISSTGPEFSGPIRIIGKATVPKEMEHLARTPARLGVAFDSIWLTAIKKP